MGISRRARGPQWAAPSQGRSESISMRMERYMCSGSACYTVVATALLYSCTLEEGTNAYSNAYHLVYDRTTEQ